MPNERISMSKLKQLIGLQSSNLSVRALGRALGLSVGAVSKYLRAVRACGIGAAEAERLSEFELERRVFGPTLAAKPGPLVPPDCAWIHGELKRHRHVTLQLLWEEYAGRFGAAAYRRSAFCQFYRRWEKRLKRSMRQRHFAGEKLFVDYAGRTVPIYGSGGVEAFRAHLFVSAMGASGCAYAEATRSESLPDWLGEPRAGAGVLRCSTHDHRARQPEGRRHARGSLRAGAAALVRGDGRALPLRRHTRAAFPAEGQKSGGVVGFTGLSLDPRAAAASALLQPRGTQRRDPPAAD